MAEQMGKEKRTCGYKPFRREPCDRPLYDDEHCIFHSKDIEGKKDEFNDAFWEEFERQKKDEKEYDFNGFVFPGDISFGGIEFEKDVDFYDSQFSGSANFRDTQFYGKASFQFVQFSGEAFYWRAQFFKIAGFTGAQFFKIAGFGYDQFSGEADFSFAQFSGMANFWATQFSEKVFFKATQFSAMAYFHATQFSGEADFNRAKFKEEANFEDIEFKKHNQCVMSDTYFYNVSGLFEFFEKNKKEFKYSNRTKFLPDNFSLILGEATEARYPIISRKIRDDMYLLSFKKKHPKLHFIWWLFADCGRSILRWAMWSIFFALYFAFNFYLIDYAFPTAFSFNEAIQEKSFWSFIYYSMVTFTTLGFGDIIPTLVWVQRWVMAEVIIGYIMLGGLISILANKLARRS